MMIAPKCESVERLSFSVFQAKPTFCQVPDYSIVHFVFFGGLPVKLSINLCNSVLEKHFIWVFTLCQKPCFCVYRYSECKSYKMN